MAGLEPALVLLRREMPYPVRRHGRVVQVGGIEPTVPSLEGWSSTIDIDLHGRGCWRSTSTCGASPAVHLILNPVGVSTRS